MGFARAARAATAVLRCRVRAAACVGRHVLSAAPFSTAVGQKPSSPPEAAAGPSASSSGGIHSRGADFSRWYQDVISAADLIDAGPVRGTYILKPFGFALWELLRDSLDARIRASGHVNAYFPLLFPVSFLSKEAAHVSSFSKECAVVTHHRLRQRPPPEGGGAEGPAGGASSPASVEFEVDPASRLSEPLVLRPTSEAVIWDAFSRWVRTRRDLPILLNQWANVVRWELRPRPFLRTTEFLWQEGHTAHATAAEALEETRRMARMYVDVAENVLAMPVVEGRKSASEKFPGAEVTWTCEAIMQNGPCGRARVRV